MKKNICFTALALCVLFSSVLAFGAGWMKYTFKDLGFTINCPEGWNVSKVPAGGGENMVAIVLPKDTARSGFKANMVILSSVNETGYSGLDEIYKNNISQMASSPDFPGFKQENSYKIKLGEDDAYQTTFTYRHPKLDVKLKSFQIYMLKGDRLYIIQYAASTITYKKRMDEVNEVVRTFQPV